MASINMDPSVAGFVVPKLGVYSQVPTSAGAAQTITNNVITDVANPISNRQGMQLSVFNVIDIANTETLNTGLPNGIACAFQPEDATDDDVRAAITGFTAVGARSRASTVLTFVAGGTRSGWIWMLHGT